VTVPLEALIADLSSPKSARRRAAAKALRNAARTDAGPALLSSLRRELQDLRTWETQYQMVMALGTCGGPDAVPFLQELATKRFEATILYLAIGDALVRLAVTPDERAEVIRSLTREAVHDSLRDGAFRAMAMLRLVPATDVVELVIKAVRQRALRDPIRFWVAAACAGWEGKVVDEFLEECMRSPRKDIQDAASKSRQRTYGKWTPL
jgi:hypothetical protein